MIAPTQDVAEIIGAAAAEAVINAADLLNEAADAIKVTCGLMEEDAKTLQTSIDCYKIRTNMF